MRFKHPKNSIFLSRLQYLDTTKCDSNEAEGTLTVEKSNLDTIKCDSNQKRGLMEIGKTYLDTTKCDSNHSKT